MAYERSVGPIPPWSVTISMDCPMFPLSEGLGHRHVTTVKGMRIASESYGESSESLGEEFALLN